MGYQEVRGNRSISRFHVGQRYRTFKKSKMSRDRGFLFSFHVRPRLAISRTIDKFPSARVDDFENCDDFDEHSARRFSSLLIFHVEIRANR